MKTQYKIVACGIDRVYGTTWENNIENTKDAISLLKRKYITEYMRNQSFKKLNFFWLELYQSSQEEREVGHWTGGKLIASMGCRNLIP